MQWCKFACKYCSNPDTRKKDWWTTYTIDWLVEELLSYKAYYGKKWWVTFSGGECTLQAEALVEVCSHLKKERIHICIDTNGSQMNSHVEKLLGLTDIVLLDIKHSDEEKHLRLTWAKLTPVLNFLEYLEDKEKPYRIRHVVIPWYTDAPEHMQAFAQILSWKQYLKKLNLLPYHEMWLHKWVQMWRKYPLAWVSPPSNQTIDTFRSLCKAKLSDSVLVQ